MQKIEMIKQNLERIQNLLESYCYAISLRELPENFLMVTKIMSPSMIAKNGKEWGIKLNASLKSESRREIEQMFGESATVLANEYVQVCQEIAQEDNNINRFMLDDENAELLSKVFFSITKAVKLGLLKYKQVVDHSSLKLFFENTILEVRVPKIVS